MILTAQYMRRTGELSKVAVYYQASHGTLSMGQAHAAIYQA
jgi:hypothetical protein